MKKFLLWSVLLFFLAVAHGQKQGNTWYFGNHAGLDFNSSPPAALLNGQTYFPSCCSWNEGCSSISDSSGALLFYTNGETIWNSQQQVMPNGNNLMGHASSTESSIIVPQPGSSRYFYVFTTDAEENNFQNGLRYSVVDICLAGGLGDVVPAEKNIKLLDSVAEKLVCIRHANGNDYWIVTHKFNSDAFYSFRLTSSGIADTVVSNTGTPDPQGWGGQMVASPDGQKIAYAIPSAQTWGKSLLLDFDASTGIVSNERTLSTSGREYGAAFSPDNSKLYFSLDGAGEIFEYNLNAGNLSAIIASKTYIVQNGPDSWRDMRLGPDGKIYLSRGGKPYISMIQYPDSLYPACNYVDSAIYLSGKLASFGLPNFIAGYNYANTTFNCFETVPEPGNSDEITLYPNPFSEQATLWAATPLVNATLTVYNDLGQVVKQTTNINGQTVIIYRGTLANGVYFVRLTQDDREIATKKLIVMN